MNHLKVSSSLHTLTAPVFLRFLPLNYAPTKGQEFTANSARSSAVGFLPLNYAPSKGQQFTAQPARSSIGAVPPIKLCSLYSSAVNCKLCPLQYSCGSSHLLMHLLKVSSSLHNPPAPVKLRFLPLTYAPSECEQFTARSAHSSSVGVPPINLCTL